MNATKAIEAALTPSERRLLASLSSPAKIQEFLDTLPYSTDDRYRCPLAVWRERRAHCFDGAVFAAAALKRLGHRPLVIDMFAYRDDDHVIAIFKIDGCFGAVAKSNFVGLRYREPIHRTLRELVISYFEDFYNIEGLKTLRSYTRPLNLNTFERFNWLIQDEAMERIAVRLDTLCRVPLLTRRMIAQLQPMDRRAYDAGLLGAHAAGLWRPEA